MRRLHQHAGSLVGSKANLRTVEADDAGDTPLDHLDSFAPLKTHLLQPVDLRCVPQDLANVTGLAGSEQIQGHEVVHGATLTTCCAPSGYCELRPQALGLVETNSHLGPIVAKFDEESIGAAKNWPWNAQEGDQLDGGERKWRTLIGTNNH